MIPTDNVLKPINMWAKKLIAEDLKEKIVTEDPNTTKR